MKATFKRPIIANAVNPGKPVFASWVVVAHRDGHFFEPVVARCYKSARIDASTVYACIWVCVPNRLSLSGHGRAAGYVYHKESAAINEAIMSAGITLRGSPHNPSVESEDRCHIDGVGNSAIENALLAIACAAGFQPEQLHVVVCR